MRDPAAFCEAAIQDLKDRIPGNAIIAASGGIDSTIAAVLTQRAVGDRAKAIFVDTGFLRQGEVEAVGGYFRQSGVRFRVVDASDRFLGELEGITDPEEKRRRIGRAFIRLFEAEAANAGTDRLVQGTIAPDWIESGGSGRDTIKTHHNVGGVPKDSALALVEPLRDLYKDEVRLVADYLKIPKADRQPFPGPGLAVRVVGPISRDRVALCRAANAIVEDEVEKAIQAGTLPRPWQYFAVLLPVRTVGVTGDNRIHAEAVSVRIVASNDAMTATAVAPPPELLRRIAERITRERSGQIARVLYDITDKPPATIEWE